MATDVDVVVIGAGACGIYAVIKYLSLGLTVKCIEAEDDVGGTWLRNCYPGARCDFAALEYCYWFSKDLLREWKWSCKYPAQPEILAYLKHVSSKFGVYEHTLFKHRVSQLKWLEEDCLWEATASSGKVFRSRFVFLAVGGLSAAYTPTWPGLSSFQGQIIHTASWPRTPISLAGKRVAIIGTGSTGVQLIPELAKEASILYVLQRTAAFTAPARNRPYEEDEIANFCDDFEQRRAVAFQKSVLGFSSFRPPSLASQTPDETRKQLFKEAWERGGHDPYLLFGDTAFSQNANTIVQDLFREKIREVVKDPELLDDVLPTGINIVNKRPVVDHGNYHATLTHKNVVVVNLKKKPLEYFNNSGFVAGNDFHEVDVVVLATGFDFLSGSIVAFPIFGRGGRSLADEWKQGAHCLWGVASSGFPNLFFAAGPFGPGGTVCAFRAIEGVVDWSARAISWLLANKYTTIEPKESVESKWKRQIQVTASMTLYPTTPSYYMGDNIPGKPREFLLYIKGFPAYSKILQTDLTEAFAFQ